eukprot:m.127135 g.127135  ORF g.127135 m.127135 type:complete len:119 (+) comp12999_c0_seq3:147-503(+)
MGGAVVKEKGKGKREHGSGTLVVPQGTKKGNVGSSQTSSSVDVPIQSNHSNKNNNKNSSKHQKQQQQHHQVQKPLPNVSATKAFEEEKKKRPPSNETVGFDFTTNKEITQVVDWNNKE